MIARFLDESILMKNPSNNQKMEDILNGFGLPIEGFFDGTTSLLLSDGKPGNWFVMEKDGSKYVFFSYSYSYSSSYSYDSPSDQKTNNCIALVFSGDSPDKAAKMNFDFGPGEDGPGYLRDLMKRASKHRSVKAVSDFFNQESLKKYWY